MSITRLIGKTMCCPDGSWGLPEPSATACPPDPETSRTPAPLDDNGHPRLTIRVSGTNPTASAVVEALIDTGFTGFLMLPIAQALPLGLALYGTGNYTLA